MSKFFSKKKRRLKVDVTPLSFALWCGQVALADIFFCFVNLLLSSPKTKQQLVLVIANTFHSFMF